MKILYFIALILALSFHLEPVKAETVLQVHTVSYHANRAANFNEENYGIGLRHYVDNWEYKFNYVNLGTYKNSENNTSNYLGVGWEYPIGDLKLGINAGIITGYSLGEVLPYVVPVISYKNVSLVFAPYPEAVAHLTIDIMNF